MYRQGRYLAIPGMVGYPWDPQTIPLIGSPSRKFDPDLTVGYPALKVEGEPGALRRLASDEPKQSSTGCTLSL